MNTLWFLDNEAIAIFAEPVFYFDQTGTFDLGLTVTDIYGCSYSTNESVVLQNALDLTGFFVPNVITPNGDDQNERFELPAAVASCLNLHHRHLQPLGTTRLHHDT